MTPNDNDEAGQSGLNAQELEKWLADEKDNLTRDTIRRVGRWVYPHGGCIAPAERERLQGEAESAVGEASAEVLNRGTFVGARPLQVRSFVLKTAAGKVISVLKAEWLTVPLDDAVLADRPNVTDGESRGGSPLDPKDVPLSR